LSTEADLLPASQIDSATLLRVKALLLATLAPAAAALVAASAGVSAPRLAPPDARDLAYAGPIRDSIVRSTATRALQSTATWGGTFTAATGEQVNISISDAYPVDNAVGQRWADFLAQLVHGPEIGRVNILLASTAEIRSTCGRRALACYNPSDAQLVAPAEDEAGGPTAEAVLAHEYGHHVAANRANNPWPTVDWGTKRWATYLHICVRSGTGEVHPGDEGVSYMTNPGEAFAETYRVLNERRLGRPETPWQIVDRLFYPDDAALAAVEQDVVSPWAGATVERRTGAGRTRTFSVSTPLDGTVRAWIRGKGTVEILGTTGKRLAQGTATASATVCDQRSVRVRVTRPVGLGAYTLTVTHT
jgi:hypothetical protein